MAKRPKHEPEVTDLARYRKAKAEAAKAKPKAGKPGPAAGRGGEGFLGSNPRAGLILAIVAVVLALLFLGPILLW